MIGIERKREIVTTGEALEAAVRELGREPVLGVDTEANSFFVYRERTCLVQVSSEAADYILDPQAVDLAPFMAVLADPSVEKVFHASEFDVLSLKRDYGVTIRNLFDTSIAAKAVGRRKLGLAGLVEEILGVTLAKDEQRSDWGRRPLTAQQVEYAYADTRHLIQIARVLKEEVSAAGLAEEVGVDCERVVLKEPRPREYDPDVFERHPRARRLDPVSRRVLRELFAAREERARELDKPPFRVVADDALVEMAARKASTRDLLRGIPGLTPPVLARHGDLLLEVAERALRMEPLPLPRRVAGTFDPAEEERYERLREWRKKMAEARKVEVEVIAGNAVLRAIARARPSVLDDLSHVSELDAYRRSRYGPQLLACVQRP